MSSFKKTSKSILRESLRIFDEDSEILPEKKQNCNRKMISKGTKKDLLLKASAVKEIEAVKKRLKRKESLVEENLEKLKLLSQPLKEKTAKRILQNIGYQAESSQQSKKRKPEDERTVFTEEDFAKFEREYFGC
nr:PREDICTED: active regulator of SIRT1-like [Bemisia tabaci]